MSTLTDLEFSEIIARLDQMQRDINDIKRAMNLPVDEPHYEFISAKSEDEEGEDEDEGWVCSKCGGKVGELDEYCLTCGEKLEDE